MGKYMGKVNIWQYRLVEYIVYFLVFSVPLYFSASFRFAYGTPKSLILTTGALLAISVFMWGHVKGGVGGRHSVTYVQAGVVMYFIALTLSGLFGVDASNSFFGSFEQPVSLVLLYMLGILALVVDLMSRERAEFYLNIVNTIFVSGVVVSICSYFDLKSTLGNDSYVGAYLLFVFCFGLIILFNTRKNWVRLCASVGLLGILFSPVFFNFKIFTGSVSVAQVLHNPVLVLGSAMGAALGLAAALALAMFLYMFRSGNLWVKRVGAVLMVVFMVSVFVAGYQFMNPDASIHKLYVAEKTGSRFIFWDIARSGLYEKPLLGYGYGNYFHMYEKYFHPEMLSSEYTEELWVNQPHNVVWEYLATGGVVGLFTYLALFIYILYLAFKYSVNAEGERDYFYIMIFGMLVGYFLQNLFVFDTITTYLMFFVIIGLLSARSPVLFSFSVDSKSLRIFMAYVVAIGSMLAFFWLVVLPFRESRAWQRLAVVNNLAEVPKMIDGVGQISLMGNPRDKAYIYDKYAEVLSVSLNKINKENKMGVLSVVDKLVSSLEEEKDDFRAHLVAGKLLNLYVIINGKVDENMINKAEMHLEKAGLISPNNALVYLTLAQTKALEGDMALSKDYVKKSLDLSPGYELTYEFGKNLVDATKDKEFAKYLESMRTRYLHE